MPSKVLVVEDNQNLAELIELHLHDINCNVDMVNDGHDAYNMIQQNQYDMVILDLILPSSCGIELCQRIRAQDNHIPILMLTAKSSEFDRVLGLEVGADDYLTKPFSIREFLARVKALLRRASAFMEKAKTASPHIIHIGNLIINAEKHKVTRSNKVIKLTAKEFDLILHLAKNPGCVFTRLQLLDIVWGYGHEGYEHTVNSHINRLRSKIEEDPKQPRYIQTVWGVGYKFFDPNENMQV